MDLLQIKTRLSEIPRWRQYCYGAAIIFGLVYLGWCWWGNKPQTASQGFVTAKPAVSAHKIDGPIVVVPIKIVPKAAVKKKYPQSVIRDEEEVTDTAVIPDLPHGGTAIVTTDVETGTTSTQIQENDAPWFEFRRKNIVEVNAVLGTMGTGVAADYKREILAIKDVALQVGVGARIPIGSIDKPEAHVLAGIKYEW